MNATLVTAEGWYPARQMPAYADQGDPQRMIRAHMQSVAAAALAAAPIA